MLFITGLALSTTPATTDGSDAHYKILAVQHQEFASYNTAYNGFLRGLEESDLWSMISIERFNAEKDMALLKKKLTDVGQTNSIDLFFTMGTKSTKLAAKIIQHIPVVFTVVSSPVNSGIISNWKSSGSNLTGIGAPDQILKGVTQIHELNDFASIGITYLKGSPSHEAVLKQVKAMCKKNGIKFISDGFSLPKAKWFTPTPVIMPFLI